MHTGRFVLAEPIAHLAAGGRSFAGMQEPATPPAAAPIS
jgi:hypothetical protein